MATATSTSSNPATSTCANRCLPYSPGEYRQGVFCWKNLFRETGETRFEKVTGNGLAVEASLRYDREKQLYENATEAKAPGLPYLFFADVDNDGLQDALAIGPSDSSWSPRTEDVGGRFWKNLGGFRFEERTDAAGLSALNWTYRQWHEFFEQPMSDRHRQWRPLGATRSQPGVPSRHPLENRPYYADGIFGDFDNDGWLDFVALDRRENPNLPTRAMLWMNRGDGTFEPKPTTFSGLDSGGISAEAADLNGDGLLDLFFAADPDNTGVALDISRYESKVYWNTGEHGAKAEPLAPPHVHRPQGRRTHRCTGRTHRRRQEAIPLDSQQPQLQERRRSWMPTSVSAKPRAQT